jgi:hypothetical protein
MVDFKPVPLEIPSGMNPIPDNTNLRSLQWVDGDKFRFEDGSPETIGGTSEVILDNVISGKARTMFSLLLGTTSWLLIGTNTNFYAQAADTVKNITPLVVSTTAIPNSLDSYYITLANNPFTTTTGSTVVTVAAVGNLLRDGDVIDLSGTAGAVNGIPDTELNATFKVYNRTANSFQIYVSTAATSPGSGGGASVIMATSIIVVNQVAHGFAEGARVKITDAATFAGIPDTDINLEFIIHGVLTDEYQIRVATLATSSVSAGGGAATKVQGQIAAGEADAALGVGYGMGKYGVGKYGVSKSSASLIKQPRIYSMDRYGDFAVLTPGGNTPIYLWQGNDAIAPQVITNSPTGNYVFVFNNIIVVLGAYSDVDGNQKDNRIRWCDRANETEWTASPTNEAREIIIRSAGRFISHAPIQDGVLLFTANKTYIMRDIGGDAVFSILPVSSNVGLLAQNARVTIENNVYWMGLKNYYMYNGGRVVPIPGNSSKGVNTVRQFTYDDISQTQFSKTFAWYNEDNQEAWFHYPSADSNEPDLYTKIDLEETCWDKGTFDRTAAEVPAPITNFPRLISSDNTLYRHEVSDMIESVTVTYFTKLKPQSDTVRTFGPYTVDSNTPQVYFRGAGRQRKIRIDVVTASFNAFLESNYTQIGTGEITLELGGFRPDSIQTFNKFRMGSWHELFKQGTPR